MKSLPPPSSMLNIVRIDLFHNHLLKLALCLLVDFFMLCPLELILLSIRVNVPCDFCLDLVPVLCIWVLADCALDSVYVKVWSQALDVWEELRVDGVVLFFYVDFWGGGFL